VTVTWSVDPPVINSNTNFDTHNNHFPRMKNLLMPPVDRAFSALLEDLAERGLLDETLVAWTGEFGRSPKIQGTGRDHWGKVYSTVLAGGGIRGGQGYGASDRQAGEPAERAVHVSDFVTTIYHALGYDANTTVLSKDGRPHPVAPGKPLEGLF
jgi:uncharacterized protein (DUF1501 family)